MPNVASLQASAMLELRRRARVQDRFKAALERAYGGDRRLYEAAIIRAGNPPDQIRNFEKAGLCLQPKQLEFAAWARRLDHAKGLPEEKGVAELGFGGARGPGKSFAEFAVMAVDDCQRMPGLKGLYLRKTGKRAVEQIQDLIKAVLHSVPHKYTDGLIRFPNGSQIIVGHFHTEKEAMNYLGLEYDEIGIEEATSLSDKALRSLRLSVRTSKFWTPRMYNTTNPLGIGHMSYKKRFIDHERQFAGVMDRRRKFIFATVDDNQFINQDYVSELDTLNGAEYRAYRLGDWDVSAGAYFEQWNWEKHTIPTMKEIPEDWLVWASMDYGFNHPNIIYINAKNGDGVRYTLLELVHRKAFVPQIAQDLREVLAAHKLTNRIEFFIAGSDVFNHTGAAQKTIAEQWRAEGFDISKADTSAGSRITGAHHLSELLTGGKWLIARNCTRLIETLPYLERNPNNAEDVFKVDADEYGVGGDDAYDAARYGLANKRVMGKTRVISFEQNPFYD